MTRRLFILLVLFLPLVATAAEPGEDLKTSVHRSLDCSSCHLGEVAEGKAMPAVHCATCHAEIYEKYNKSIHGKLRAAGVESAAACQSCHGTHHILPAGDPKSSIHKKNVPFTCGQCHAPIKEEYVTSVHGLAVAKGNADAPACTDCHGEHSILPPLEKLSQVYPTNIAKTTCPQCHASERINTKYNLPVGKVESFKDTYHGMAGKIGDVKAANCASCHGVHNILASSDPRSTINATHLAATCGKCHPNANENFIKGSVHGYSSGQISGRIIHGVRFFYVILIVLVVGGFVVHNGMDYLKKVRAIYRKRRLEDSFPRMNRNERIQHLLLLISFFILVATGFALKFGWTLPFVGDSTNTFLRSTLHRICGVVMTGLLLYNIVYFVVTKRGREILAVMFPRWNDVRQAFQYFRYLLGRGEKPRFDRFTYWEKMEYWSVIWGTLVMAVTGFLMWFENWSLGFMPKWGLDIATLVHYLEAILATLAIVFGHLYFVIVNPDVAPMSFTWITGRIPKDLALEEHPQAYEKE